LIQSKAHDFYPHRVILPKIPDFLHLEDQAHKASGNPQNAPIVNTFESHHFKVSELDYFAKKLLVISRMVRP